MPRAVNLLIMHMIGPTSQVRVEWTVIFLPATEQMLYRHMKEFLVKLEDLSADTTEYDDTVKQVMDRPAPQEKLVK